MPAGAQSQKRSTWNTSLADAEARKEGIEHRFGAHRAGDPIERGARATKAFGNDQRIGIAADPCKLALRLTAQIPLAPLEHGLVEARQDIGRTHGERFPQGVHPLTRPRRYPPPTPRQRPPTGPPA